MSDEPYPIGDDVTLSILGYVDDIVTLNRVARVCKKWSGWFWRLIKFMAFQTEILLRPTDKWLRFRNRDGISIGSSENPGGAEYICKKSELFKWGDIEVLTDSGEVISLCMMYKYIPSGELLKNPRVVKLMKVMGYTSDDDVPSWVYGYLYDILEFNMLKYVHSITVKRGNWNMTWTADVPTLFSINFGKQSAKVTRDVYCDAMKFFMRHVFLPIKLELHECGIDHTRYTFTETSDDIGQFFGKLS